MALFRLRLKAYRGLQSFAKFGGVLDNKPAAHARLAPQVSGQEAETEVGCWNAPIMRSGEDAEGARRVRRCVGEQQRWRRRRQVSKVHFKRAMRGGRWRSSMRETVRGHRRSNDAAVAAAAAAVAAAAAAAPELLPAAVASFAHTEALEEMAHAILRTYGSITL